MDRDRHVQREDDAKTQEEDSHLQSQGGRPGTAPSLQQLEGNNSAHTLILDLQPPQP